MAAGGILEGDDEACSGAEHTHASGGLVTAGDVLQLVSRPHTEDGSNLRSHTFLKACISY